MRSEIYNRQGELLFSSDAHQKGWGGTYRGNKEQSDTHVWRVTLKNSLMQDQQQYGRVMLID